MQKSHKNQCQFVDATLYVCMCFNIYSLSLAEYEGSPRRIGQMGNTNDEEHIRRINNKLSQNLTSVASTAAAATKTNHHNNAIGMSTAAESTASTTNTNSPKQQQHYTARPGFPQVRKKKKMARQKKIGNNNENKINISFMLTICG